MSQATVVKPFWQLDYNQKREREADCRGRAAVHWSAGVTAAIRAEETDGPGGPMGSMFDYFNSDGSLDALPYDEVVDILDAVYEAARAEFWLRVVEFGHKAAPAVSAIEKFTRGVSR